MTDQHAPRDEVGAKQAIMQLRAKYFRLMDTKDWQGLRELFIPDAVVDMREEVKRLAKEGFSGMQGDGVMRGRDAIIAMISSVQDLVTVHHGHMPEIEFQSATEATGIWAMEDIIRQPDGKGGTRVFHGYGHYHDRYVCDDQGRWRVALVRLTRLLVTTT